MGSVVTQVLAVNRERTNNSVIEQGGPYPIAWLVQPSGELCRASRDLALEKLPEIGVLRVERRMHFGNAPNQSGAISCAYGDWALLLFRHIQAMGFERSCICRQALRNRLLLGAIEVLKRSLHLHLTIGMNLPDRAAPLGRQLQ